MKNIFLAGLGLIFSGVAMAQNPSYMTLRADIANRNGEMIYIKENKKTLKQISANNEGFFKDTINIKPGIYKMYDGVEYTEMFLKNGFDLKIKLDAQNFDPSIVYEGIGANENNFLAQKTVADHQFQDKIDQMADLTEVAFKKELDAKKAADLKALNNNKLDPEFVALESKVIEQDYTDFINYFNHKLTLKALNNTVPPAFEYLNYTGGTSTLEDFKGNYVYIDIWATWCGPCRTEIPHLKKLEEKYHDKNIVFISLSVDHPKDLEKWKTMVRTKEMKGVQLFANETTRTPFFTYLKLSTIPRFVLIDPEGKIIDADAYKPSSSKITKMLDEILKS